LLVRAIEQRNAELGHEKQGFLSCSHGFIPIIVREAVGDRHPAPHEANLFDMAQKNGDVIPSRDFFAQATAAAA